MTKKLDDQYYQPPCPSIWKGRSSDPDIEPQYWYQKVQCREISELKTEQPEIALLGYACDEGVKRNLGRTGAADGPKMIRQQLAKLALHHDKAIVDAGDIICANENLEATQENLAFAVEQLLNNNYFPILIGGGHDIAYGHFKGIWNAVKNTTKNKIGIINFDAHFDLRPIETKPNSGTPFNQILSEHKDTVGYFPIGIQKESNTKQLFEIAEQFNVNYILNTSCFDANADSVLSRLEHFIKQYDCLYITIDMDGFSSAYAPGVSAPSPTGFPPYFVTKILNFLVKTGKVISCDIAELNPKYDIDNCTAKLAARLINTIAMALD